MKNLNKQTVLVGAVLLLSIGAGFLRRMLYAAALDEKGLLVRNHPIAIALWVLVAAGSLLILWATRHCGGKSSYEDNFGPSTLAVLGHSFMACAVLMMSLQVTFPLPGPLGLIWKVLGFASAAGLVWAGLYRKLGKLPFFGIYAALCLFLLLYLVSCYQLWSSNPQLQDYVFELLALVSLVLYCYQLTAFAAGSGNRKALLIFGLLSVLLCGPANFGAQVPALYAGGLLFAATNLCHLDPPPRNEEEHAHESA